MKIYAATSSEKLFDRFLGKNIWVRVTNSAKDYYYVRFKTKRSDERVYAVDSILALIVDCDNPGEDLYTEEFFAGCNGALGIFDDALVDIDDLRLTDPIESLTDNEMHEILQQKFGESL